MAPRKSKSNAALLKDTALPFQCFRCPFCFSSVIAQVGHQVDIVDNQEYGLHLTGVPAHDVKINLSAPITPKFLPPIASGSPPVAVTCASWAVGSNIESLISRCATSFCVSF